jgi:hypothetical protein
MFRITLKSWPIDILEVAKIQMPPRSEIPANTEKIMKKMWKYSHKVLLVILSVQSGGL